MIEPHSAAASTPIRSVLADDDREWDDLLRAFVETIPQKQQTLRELQRGSAVEPIRLLAHQIKGAGGGYGFPGLSEAAAELEQACRANDADQVAKTIDALVDYLGRIDV